MSKHTPGPWEVFAGECPWRWPGIEAADGTFSVVIVGGEDEDDAGVRGQTDEEAQANALLIAAAPDLLAACKRAIWWMNEERKAFTKAQFGSTFENPALDKCEAAVKKAEAAS